MYGREKEKKMLSSVARAGMGAQPQHMPHAEGGETRVLSTRLVRKRYREGLDQVVGIHIYFPRPGHSSLALNLVQSSQSLWPNRSPQLNSRSQIALSSYWRGLPPKIYGPRWASFLGRRLL